MDFLNGIFDYIEKAWNWLYCFFDIAVAAATDVGIGIYKGVLNVVISILSVIPLPDALANFSWPQLPTFIGYAVYELQVGQCLAIIVAGASVKATRWFFEVVK